MERVIYKYQLPTTYSTVLMQENAQILSVQIQDGIPQLWALVDTDNSTEFRYFHIYGTGVLIPDENLEFIGTIQNPPLVWHVFEHKP